MKKLFILIAALFLAGCATATKPQINIIQPEDRILIAGCAFGRVAVIDRQGKTLWEIQEKEEVDDAWLMPDGNIVYSYKYGVREISPNYNKGKGANLVWIWKTAAGGETHSCQPLDRNTFLIGESYDGYSLIKEITSGGVTLKTLRLDNFGGSHSSFRQIRKTAQGTYLVSQQRDGGKAFEYNDQGQLITTFPAGRFSNIQINGGHFLIGCGDEGRFIETDLRGQIVWELGRDDLKAFGITIAFAAGFQKLPNGNLLLCNWQGHKNGTGPALIEITTDKKVVWQSGSNVSTLVSTAMLFNTEIMKEPLFILK